MKRIIFTFLAAVIFISCAAQNPKARVFPNGIRVFGDPVITAVPLTSHFMVLDEEGFSSRITIADLISQLNISTGNLSQEEVEDILAAMITGGTNTGIDFTYNDNGTDPGTLDITVTGGGGAASDLQLISNILSLTDPLTPGNQIDLSPYLDNTDVAAIWSNITGIPVNLDLDSTNDVEIGDNISLLTNDLKFIQEDTSSPITDLRLAVGSTSALAALAPPSGFYRIKIDTTSSSATSDYFIDGLDLNLVGSDLTVTASRNGTTDVVSNTIELPSSGSGATNLSYTASATQGTVESDSGTDAVIPAGSTTNASLMLPGDKTKLNGVESGADVTDTANVTAAGALMDSEVDADIKTLSIPASTTVSAFGASLIDDVADTNARTTLGLADEDIQDKVGAMWSGNTEAGASVTYQDADGTMDITVSANTTNIVDGAVNSAKITDNSILEADLNVSNPPTDNHILTYNSAASNFTWVDPATIGGITATQGSGTTGITLTGFDSGTYTIGSQSWSWRKIGPFVWFSITLLDCNGTTPVGLVRINTSGTTIPNWTSGNSHFGLDIVNSPVSWSYAYVGWTNQDLLNIYYKSGSNTLPPNVMESVDMTDTAFYISGVYITNE